MVTYTNAGNIGGNISTGGPDALAEPRWAMVFELGCMIVGVLYEIGEHRRRFGLMANLINLH